MEIFLSSEAWIALLTLTLLEIVLGVDNIIFISIISRKLPESKQPKARTIGLILALVLRLIMLFGIVYIIGFTKPLFTLFDIDFSVRDVILVIGGLFLIAKSTSEIHQKLEGSDEESITNSGNSGFGFILVQIMILNLVFSFDSILTAIGLTEHIIIMAISVIISIIVMIVFVGKIGDFINKHPSLEMLALAFLILIGFMLTIEAFHYHVPKGYIYSAVFFSLIVEVLNMRLRKKKQPVHLHKRYVDKPKT